MHKRMKSFFHLWLLRAFYIKMPVTLFLLSLLFTHGFVPTPAASAESETATVRFDLIHRHSIPGLSEATTHEERIRELVELDAKRFVDMVSKTAGEQKKRIEVISSIVGSNTTVGNIIKGSGISAVLPLQSDILSRSGMYFVTLAVGSPPQNVTVIADTGSDLFWLYCEYDKIKARAPKTSFHADKSSSYRPVLCEDPLCRVLPDSLQACGPMNMCQYNMSYHEGTVAEGVFAKEKVIVELESGQTVELDDVIIGCSSSVSADSSTAAADGLLGLGYSNSSFIQTAKDNFGGVFSYCIVNHFNVKQVPSYLALGKNLNLVNERQKRYTELIFDERTLGRYFVNVAGISVGGVMLDIPSYIWDLNAEAGTMIDSGSTLTILPAPAHHAVVNALKTPALQKLATESVDNFEFCFKDDGEYNQTMVPQLIIHFEDKNRFEPLVSGYVIPAAPNVKCLAFMSSPWPSPAMIGNVMQQGYRWEFDITNKKLGFSHSSCT